MELENRVSGMDVPAAEAGEGLSGTECAVLEPEVMDIPEVGEVLVSGNPFETGEALDAYQGDNVFNFGGDCGVVTVANLVTLAGGDVSEDEVVARAIGTRMCSFSDQLPPEMNGGTTVIQRSLLLRSYGIESDIFGADSREGSLEAIADYVESNRCVNISVNAGYAWQDANHVGDGSSNHSIVVTGTARDVQTGELKGLFVCDSGLTDRDGKAVFMSVDVLQDAYVDAPGTSVLVTKDPVRAA